ncbi:LamG-like jellyroll fold domain-containing protein [Amycolatopsis sp. lyj-112]|uniref:LamG-like jellyroll fold domain-containing protein n=1 Tax=Amycolatopsis sp. lyj-112 TaxID=2789288 RepID=UPI003977E57B
MARDFEVQIDRSDVADLAFPVWEKLEQVSKIDTSLGRDYERGGINPGDATIAFEFNKGDTGFSTDDLEELVNDDYLNGFSYLASDYVSLADNKVVFRDATETNIDAKGKVFTRVGVSPAAYQWRIPFDPMYAAIIEPLETYVLAWSHSETSYSSPDPTVTEHAKAFWYSDAGVLVREDEFFTGTLSTGGATQIKGKIKAPSNARYVTVGAQPTGLGSAVKGYRDFVYSSFQVHKYDATYEASNGGNYLKPFAIDALETRPPQAGTKLRVVSPGNQFDRKKWFPVRILGHNQYQRAGQAYNLLPLAYDIDTITTVADFFTSTNATLTLNTGTPISGTKSLNIVTTASSPATITLGASSTTFMVPVTPGVFYSVEYTGRNNIATAASVNITANYFGGSTNMGTNVMGASSGPTLHSWGFTAPAGVYAVQFVMSISGGIRNITVDNFTVRTAVEEPGPHWNKLDYIGDFENLTGLNLSQYVCTSLGNTLAIVFDSTQAHKGNRVLKMTKVNGATSANARFGHVVNSFPAYTEARGKANGVAYQMTFWARASSANANTKVQAVWKSNNTQALLTSLPQQALTTQWKQYIYNFAVPSGATGLHVGVQMAGDAAGAIDVFIDEVTVTRLPPYIRWDLSSSTSNSRISIYDIDASDSGAAAMHYGNDLIEDVNYAHNNFYHSGSTRTRYKATWKSVGYDAPLGTTAYVQWVPITGKYRGGFGTDVEGMLKGSFPVEVSTPIALPTGGGSVVVDVLAPDIPWCAMVPVIYFAMPNVGATMGYEFIDEYIGPDGYENEPSVLESSAFRGSVEVRKDKTSSVAIDGERFITTAELQCTDVLGQLGNVKINTPYKQTVMNDDPLVYLPMDDDLTTIANLSSRVEVDFKVRTVGTPNNWGISTDSKSLAEIGGSFRFENPPLVPGTVQTQGQFVHGVYDGTLVDKYESSYEVWFMRDAGAAPMVADGLLNHNSSMQADGRIYIWLNGTELWYKWGQAPGVKYIYNIGSAHNDGRPHYVAMTMKNDVATCYFDGSPVGTFTATNKFVNNLMVGGNIPETYQFHTGNLGHFAWYDKALSYADVYRHWRAGLNNRLTETETARMRYVIDAAKQAGIPPVLQTRDGIKPSSTSRLTPANWSTGTSPADLMRNAADSASGTVWAGGDGRIIYENKRSRFTYGITQRNNTWEIGPGDDTIQPDGDFGASPDYTKLINEVSYTGKFSSAKDGTLRVFHRVSQNKYGRVSIEERTELSDMTEAREKANWLMYTHAKPLTRYDTLRFTNINAATDEFCRGVRIGDYIYGDLVNSNGLGEGQLSHFVEKVSHYIEPLEGKLLWTTSIEISPAYNQVGWIIEDPVYGQMDAGNRIVF